MTNGVTDKVIVDETQNRVEMLLALVLTQCREYTWDYRWRDGPEPSQECIFEEQCVQGCPEKRFITQWHQKVINKHLRGGRRVVGNDATNLSDMLLELPPGDELPKGFSNPITE